MSSQDSIVTKVVGYSVAGIGAVVFLTLVAAVSYFLNGLVLSITWEWFIVSTFGAPTISIVEAIGIMIVASTFTRGLATKGDVGDDKDLGMKYAALAGRIILLPLMVLATAWIIYQFM